MGFEMQPVKFGGDIILVTQGTTARPSATSTTLTVTCNPSAGGKWRDVCKAVAESAPGDIAIVGIPGSWKLCAELAIRKGLQAAAPTVP